MGWTDGLAFGGSDLDRAAHLRADPDGMAALHGQGLTLTLWHGKPLVEGEGAPALVWLPAGHPVLEGADAPVFLGMTGNAPRFAQDLRRWDPGAGEAGFAADFLDASRQRHPRAPDGAEFRELRGVMTGLTASDAELAATAKALIGWHTSHGFCAACGAASVVSHAGWQRACPSCHAHHFPRTDPVVIMLVVRGARVLVGRSPGWPAGMYSCLAGFVEPGETAEAAVRREVLEETAVRVGDVRYVTSQPWPFPASLMMGFVAEAESEAITLDPVELEDARWVPKAEMMDAMSGTHPTMTAARKGAIAHHLIRGWLSGRIG